MPSEPTLIERLRAKDRAWQEQCDGWIAEVRKMGGEVTAEQEAVIRRTIYAEAAERTLTPVPDGDAVVDSGMDGDTVERAEWLWVNLPTNKKWTSLATHEKALVCHTVAALSRPTPVPDAGLVERFAKALSAASACEYKPVQYWMADARAALSRPIPVPDGGLVERTALALNDVLHGFVEHDDLVLAQNLLETAGITSTIAALTNELERRDRNEIRNCLNTGPCSRMDPTPTQETDDAAVHQ
jgi:hypothetical protein